VPFADFEKDAAAGTLPDFSLIEPNMLSGHGDYHPAVGRSFSDAVDIKVDNPSSTLAGEAFLARVFDDLPLGDLGVGHERLEHCAVLIGCDEPGGTIRPRRARTGGSAGSSAPPASAASPSTARVIASPAVIVSPWVESGSVYNEEYRHTSLIAMLRKIWGIGDAFTQQRRDRNPTFDHVFTLDTPRDPKTWTRSRPLPCPNGRWTRGSSARRSAHARLRAWDPPYREGRGKWAFQLRRTQRPDSKTRPRTESFRFCAPSLVTSSPC